MERIIVEGPAVIKGQIHPQGSKNTALPLLSASIIFDTIIKIKNIPNIIDIQTMLSILQELGANFNYIENTLIIDSRQINKHEISWQLASKMRASFDLLGSLVYRFSKAVVPFPGGCLIGNRKVDMHLWIAQNLGFQVEIESGNVKVDNFNPKKVNTEITFWIPSVGATKNATFLGLFVTQQIKKEIIFHNIAIEPEITFLWDLLKDIGFKINYDTSKRIIKISPSKLNTKSVINIENIPDRIEAGTFAIAAVATKGNLTIIDPQSNNPKYSLKNMLQSLWENLEKIGVDIKFQNNTINIKTNKKLKTFEISTDVYPNFPTDLQPQMTTLATTINGISVIKENLFDDRFIYVGELLRLGADINVINNKMAIVKGGKKLKGAPVKATDIRGGASILIATLVSQGKSYITNTYQINRGYEKIVDKLKNLSVKIYEEKELIESINTSELKVIS